MTTELTGPEQADFWATTAREHWEAGRLAEAAAFNHACSEVDADRASLWQSRADRLLTAGSTRPLQEQTAVRLAVAGFGPDDPALTQIREHNAQVAAREMELQ